MADIVAHILGSRFTGDKKQIEFFKMVKSLEFISRALFEIKGKKLPRWGFKVVKEKEAGDLFSSGRTT